MKLVNFSNYIKESLHEIELHYYAFDIDDNLFHMPTVIHMLKKVGDNWVPIDVSTTEFAKVRNDKDNYKLLPGNESFSEFRDNGPRGNMAFIEDMKIAIRNGLFGPSWDSFIQCLSEGAIFALITARGNEPSTYRKSIEYIIDNFLTEQQQFEMYSHCLKNAYYFSHNETDQYARVIKGQVTKMPLIKVYLDHCGYYGVSSESFAEEFGSASASNPEKAKEMALNKFVDTCNEYGNQIGAKTVSVGFSDDDTKNVEHIHKFFKEKSLMTNLKFNLYDTSNASRKGGVRTRFVGDEEVKYESSVQAKGMESSILPFTKWNNMTQKLYPNSMDAPTDDYHNQMKNNVKQAIDLKDKFKKNESFMDREEMINHLCNVGFNELELEAKEDYELEQLCKEVPQEISEAKKWMNDLKLKKGALKKKAKKKGLIKDKDEKLSMIDIKKLKKDSDPLTRKRATLAETFMKSKK
jgi:hypothetical protein